MFSLRRALPALAIAMAVPVCAAQAATFTIDRTDDPYDSAGSACTSAPNDCSLRGAVEKANATAGADNIVFDATVFAGNQTIAVSPPSGEPGSGPVAFPAIRSDLSITGPETGVNIRTFNGSGLLTVDVGANVNLANLNLSVSSQVLFNRGNTTATRCTFGGSQMGVGVTNLGTFTARESIISADQSAFINGGTATIERSVIAFTKNAINNGGVLTLRNSTVAAANAFANSFGDTTIESCTILGSTINNANFTGEKTSNSIVRVGHRFRGDGGNNLFGAEVDAAGLDPAGLKDNGGPTPTIALLPGGTAINASRTALATDQRGVARPQNAIPDIGAFELQSATPEETPSLVVTTLDDATANDGQTSLREAINYANFKLGGDSISFADNVRGTLNLASQLPLLTSNLAIQGPGARVLTLDGGGATRLLRIASGADVSVLDLTLSGGDSSAFPSDGRGGAVLNEGVLTLRQVALTGNKAIYGGGFYDNNGRTTLVGCLVSGNRATLDGGGFYNNNGRITLISSTLSGNRAMAGGGFDEIGAASNISLDSVTITGNSANSDDNGAGLRIRSGELRLHNSIVSGNGERFGDIRQGGGTFNSQGYNIIGGRILSDGNGGTVASDRVGADPQLGPLQDNGGQTFTHALLAGSAAINAGDPSTNNGFDQRGFPRVRGGRVDIGAFETQQESRPVSVSISPRDPLTNAVLTATPEGFSEGAVISYQWKRNGQNINETAATIDLSKDGRGDKGDVISVEVTAADGSASDSVTVANSAPFGVTIRGEVAGGEEIRLPLSAFDADGDPLAFGVVSGPNNGTAFIETVAGKVNVATLIYRSRAGYNGVEVIRFIVVDNQGKESAPSTVGIVVKSPPANRAPIAGDTNINTFVGEAVVKALLGSDPDGDAVSFRIVNNARFGRSEITRDANGQFKQLLYTGLNRFYGPDRVTYVAIDSRGKESNVATININFLNRAPVARGNQLQVASGELVSQFLFADDRDNDAVTFRLVNNPRFGSGEVKRDEQGQWRVFYRSIPGYVGTDVITFIAIDARGKESQVAPANINVVRVSSSSSAVRARAVKAPSGGGS